MQPRNGGERFFHYPVDPALRERGADVARHRQVVNDVSRATTSSPAVLFSSRGAAVRPRLAYTESFFVHRMVHGRKPDPRHRRRRIHRLEFRPRVDRRGIHPPSSTSTSSPTRATSPTWRASSDEPRHVFVRGDIADGETVARLLERHRPRAIVNFAAESHVDRSIHGPADFVQTNIVGTFTLLEAARSLLVGAAGGRPRRLPLPARVHRRSLRIAGAAGPAVHARRARTLRTAPTPRRKPHRTTWCAATHHTYGLPTITTNCSNNYGPYQFPEKLIPLMIVNALEGKPLPVYGDGSNVRDWLYVADHCEAVRLALARGRPGETYNIGGNAEKTNLDVVRSICAILDELRPDPLVAQRSALITYVPDRPGHDRRYAIDSREDTARARLAAARGLRDGPAQDRAMVPRQHGAGSEQ